MLVLLILIPCCLVGLVVYAAMSRWEITDPTPYRSDGAGAGSGGYGGGRRQLPRLTMRETAMDWPVPQLERVHPGVLLAVCAVLGVWILAWVVIFFVGLGMLHA